MMAASASPVGVILGVGGGHHENVQREADLEPSDLDVPLFHDVEQPDLDPLRQIGKLVDGEDPAVDPG